MLICPTCRLNHPDGARVCLVDGTPLENIADPRIGSLVGGTFRIERVVGAGGMATVYAATHTLKPGRLVAIKILHPRFADDAKVRTRLEREARAAATVAHPNVVDVYDFGLTEDGVPYLVCELLVGSPLDRYRQAGSISVADAAGLGLQVARGLGRAHDLGVVHRDVKPENIFVCRSDDGEPVVKLVDFGIALGNDDSRLTAAGHFVGSPQYMAPERFRGEPDTAASDIYSLGVVLYELLTGEPLFQAATLPGYLLMHLEQAPPDVRLKQPKCPEGLSRLVAEMLAKKPIDRPADAHIVEKRLAPFATQKSRVMRHVSANAVDGARSRSTDLDLDAWSRRVNVYREMIALGFPRQQPEDLLALVDRLAHAVESLRGARATDHALVAQLDDLDDGLRTRRAQLGRAISTLAADLSHARAEFRERCPHPETWRAQLERVEALHLEHPHVPGPEVLACMREATAAYGEWMRAWEATPIKDLMFQLEQLRRQQEDIESSARKQQSEVALRATHRSVARTETETSLLRISHDLNTRLRPIEALRPHFERLI
ncbi:MAG: protein kinase [Sandaracinaceae bacterium]|nr:protein kinase [Sandaracinaceae bacterium]